MSALKTLYLSLLLLPGLLSAQLSPRTEKERREWANRVYREAVRDNDSLQLAEAYYLFGKLESFVSGSYLRTRVWYLKSLYILETRPVGFPLIRLYTRLGGLEQDNGTYAEAMAYYRKALSLAEEAGIDAGRLLVYSHLGMFYAGYREDPQERAAFNPYMRYDSATYYYDRAEELAMKLKEENGLKEIRSARNHLHMLQGSPSKTTDLELFRREVSGSRNNLEIASLLTLSEHYLNTGQPAKALASLEKAREVRKKYMPYDSPAEDRITAHFIHYYQKVNDWKNAFLLLTEQKEKGRKLEAQIKNEPVYRTYYQQEQKEIILQHQEEELRLQSENIRLQRWSLVFAALLLAMALGSALVLFRLYRKNKKISQVNALLVQEQSHRFRNNLQVVSNLLNMQSVRIDAGTARQAMTESQLRLEAIASLHRRLYNRDTINSIQLEPFLKEIVAGVLRTFDQEHVQVTCRIAPLEVGPDEALTLGLIVNELTTNACKYAFPTVDTPTYEVIAAPEDKYLVLKVSDNGRFEHSLMQASFGARMIEMLAQQLQGTCRYENGNGLNFILRYKRPKPKQP